MVYLNHTVPFSGTEGWRTTLYPTWEALPTDVWVSGKQYQMLQGQHFSLQSGAWCLFSIFLS